MKEPAPFPARLHGAQLRGVNEIVLGTSFGATRTVSGNPISFEELPQLEQGPSLAKRQQGNPGLPPAKRFVRIRGRIG